jgi:hypothetical protein
LNNIKIAEKQKMLFVLFGDKELSIATYKMKRFGKFASENKNCEIKNTKAKQG